MSVTTLETPTIVETDEQPYAGLHLTIPTAQIREAMGPGLREVSEAIAAQGIATTGPWFTYHFKRPDSEFDFEICVPVAEPIAPAGRVMPGVMPRIRVARTIYRGDYSGLPAAWGEFTAWISEQGLHEAKDLWERYLVNPDSTRNPEEWRTELNRPLIG